MNSPGNRIFDGWKPTKDFPWDFHTWKPKNTGSVYMTLCNDIAFISFLEQTPITPFINHTTKLKADCPQPRYYPYMPTNYRHTDKHIRLAMTLRSNGSLNFRPL